MPSSLEEGIEQSSTENKPDSALKDANVDGGAQDLDNTPQEITETVPSNPVAPSLELVSQDAIPETSVPESMAIMPSTPPQSARSSWLNTRGGHKALHRSNSMPSSSSPPTTGASSNTLFSTPTHSDTSFSPSLLKLRQAVEEHRKSTKPHDLALAEHL